MRRRSANKTASASGRPPAARYPDTGQATRCRHSSQAQHPTAPGLASSNPYRSSLRVGPATPPAPTPVSRRSPMPLPRVKCPFRFCTKRPVNWTCSAMVTSGRCAAPAPKAKMTFAGRRRRSSHHRGSYVIKGTTGQVRVESAPIMNKHSVFGLCVFSIRGLVAI